MAIEYYCFDDEDAHEDADDDENHAGDDDHDDDGDDDADYDDDDDGDGDDGPGLLRMSRNNSGMRSMLRNNAGVRMQNALRLKECFSCLGLQSRPKVCFT